MPNPIVGYDDGLTHYTFPYLSDGGVTFNCSIRACYIDDGTISAAANPVGTPANKPIELKPRHLVLTGTTADNGRYLKRTVPCNLVDVQALFAGPPNTIPTVTVDGEIFNITGYHGESYRGSEAPT